MRRLAARLFCALALLSASCTLMVSGCEMNGRVVDSETGAPVPGALVIAQWSGDVGGPVQSSHVCFHLEVATTDVEGRYHIPSWARRPVTDWEGGFFGVRNVEVARWTYRAGYKHLKYDPNDSTVILMARSHDMITERLNDLAHSGTPGCGSADGSLAKEVRIWQAVCGEVRNYPEARVYTKEFGNQTFIDLINAHLSGIERRLTVNPVDDPPASVSRCE